MNFNLKVENLGIIFYFCYFPVNIDQFSLSFFFFEFAQIKIVFSFEIFTKILVSVRNYKKKKTNYKL
jgi:hypothetical protein